MTLLWWLDGWRGGVFAAIAAVYVLGLNGRWRITSDSAWYVLQARTWGSAEGAETAGVALGATPPGLPMLIAALGGSAGWGTSLAMWAVAAGVLWLSYQMFVEHADRPTAVLMTALVALSGLFMEMTFGLLTELPFTAGLLLLLWGHERRMNRKGRLSLALGMMLVGVVWMAMFRSVAAVVVGAYVLAEVVHVVARRDQQKLGLALIGLASAGAIVLWAASPAIRDDAGFFRSALLAKTPEAWWISFQILMTEALPEAVFGQDVPPPLAWPTSIVVVLAGLMLVRARLLWGVLLGVFVAQWVVFLADPRYVLPILPLVFYGLWRSGVGLLGKWPEPWRGLGFGLGVLALFGANVIAVVNVIGEQRSGDFYAEYRSGKYAAVVELAEVIRQETPADAQLIVVPDVGLELAALSHRRSVNDSAELTPPFYVVGMPREALLATVEYEVQEIGSAIDRRTGQTWTVQRFERTPQAEYD